MKIKIPFSRRIQELINRNNIQVRSLDKLDDNLRKLYTAGQKKGILIFRTKVLEVQIHIIDDIHIKIVDINLSVFVRAGDSVIIILPANEGKRYVLQALVKELFVDRLKLQILDPRSNERVKLIEPISMAFWQVPPLFMAKLENDNLQIIREIKLIRESQPAATGTDAATQTDSVAAPRYSIVDWLAEKDEKQASDAYKKFLERKPASSELIDISLGGMCIKTAQGLGKELNNYFLYVTFDSSTQLDAKGASLQPGLNISSFAVVRSYNSSPDGDQLHIMFLSQLPAEAVQFFPV